MMKILDLYHENMYKSCEWKYVNPEETSKHSQGGTSPLFSDHSIEAFSREAEQF